MTVYSILKTIIVSAVNDIVQEHRKMNDNVQLWININKKENLHNLTKNSTFSKSIFAHLLIMYSVHKRDLFLHIYTEIKKKQIRNDSDKSADEMRKTDIGEK